MIDPIVTAEIDLKSIGCNVEALRRRTRSSTRLMAVVKADGYGHGAAPVAHKALKSGADALGVARLAEAIALREAGIEAPILILGHTAPDQIGDLIDQDLIQTVFSLEDARQYSRKAALRAKPLEIHLKIDTGMGRLGFLHTNPGWGAELKDRTGAVVADVERLFRLPALKPSGIYTHFASADHADKAEAREQLAAFLDVVDRLRGFSGIEFPTRHAANSAGIIDIPESHLDMVRAGISIYGLYPSPHVNRDSVQLKPAMTLKSRIVQLKQVPAGFRVSYGGAEATGNGTNIATVAVGYADGVNRQLSSRGNMLVKGRCARIIGRVCMDLTMLDVGGIPGVAPGDEVVIFGRQGDAEIHVDEVAALLNTINYEVVSTITARVKRVYLP